MNPGHIFWTPSAEFQDSTNLKAYMNWLEQRLRRRFSGYDALHQWSVADPDAFWQSLWDWFGIEADGAIESVRSSSEMPGCRWFTGTRLNFAEHMLRHGRNRPDATAVMHMSETRAMAETSWGEIASAVRRIATRLRDQGVKPGDRVVAYAPNIVETLIAMLATTAIGAVWSSAAPEFGAQSVLDRFAQVEPVVLFAVDGYHFGGRDFDRTGDVAAIVAGLPSLRLVIGIGNIGLPWDPAQLSNGMFWRDMLAAPDPEDGFRFERVPANDPLWILFSSGTTGIPKAIVHSHVGILLELFKLNGFHADTHAGDRTFFYATTSWMVWNSLVSGMLLGAIPILYDGHPARPADLLWRLCDEAGATSFGASPTFVHQMHKIGIVPRDRFALTNLRTVVLSGSPATEDSFHWFYRCVKPDLWVTTQSGGTEFCSGLVGGVPILPVVGGRIQARCLGMAVEAWDDAGRPVTGEPGELVVTAPCPSMPLSLWGDEDGARYADAYFSHFPGVWRHGDFIAFEPDGSCMISGRSDATLNRHGVRIGAAEIYNVVAGIAEVADSIVLGIDSADRGFWMPLFVKPMPGERLDDALADRIRGALKREASPRHVPDEIIEVPDIPYTLTGKKMEIPLRRLLTGSPADQVMCRDTMMNPGIVAWYEDFVRSRNESLSAAASS